MPRAPRVHFEGAIFHAMSRGNRGQSIFLDTADRVEFLEVLRQIKQRFPFYLYAYCLMSNHFHLLVRVDRHPLAHVMQALLSRYAGYFNSRHQATGHLFQSRYKALLCTEDSYFLELLRYIHLNPVRAGLSDDPEAWRWSSHTYYIQRRPDRLVDTTFPLSIFDADENQGRESYCRFVSDGMNLGDNFPLPKQTPVPANVCTGGARELPNEADVPPLELIAASLARENGIEVESIRGKSRMRSVSDARHDFIRRAVARGYRSAEIAAYLNATLALVSKAVRN